MATTNKGGRKDQIAAYAFVILGITTIKKAEAMPKKDKTNNMQPKE